MIEETNYEFIEDPVNEIETYELSSMNDESEYSEDFGEVLEITEYTGNESNTSISNYVDAEYQDIDLGLVSSKQENLAKTFVDKVKKFIIKLDDIEISKEQKQYLDIVSRLELNKLQDLLVLTEVNMQLIGNLTRRINSVQAEDYVMIQTYNNLVNQHIKLHKEVSNTYRNIPLNIRKLQTDVVGDNQQISNKKADDGLLTQDFGTTQFNNSKQLLKNLEDQRKSRES